MAEPIQFTRLYEGDIVDVADARCRPHDRSCGGEEHSTATTLVFARRGVFVRHVGKNATVADPNGVLFFRRGETYRVSHPVEGGDDCTSLRFAPALLADAFAHYQPGVRDHPEDPVNAARVPLGSQTLLAVQRLRGVLRKRPIRNRGEGTSVLQSASAPRSAGLSLLALEESALGILDAVARDAARFQDGGTLEYGRKSREDTLRAHRDLCERTRIVLSAMITGPVRLGAVAQRVHSSPFHLTRAFHHYAGLPMHRFLTRLRLGAAVEHLAEGEEDLARLAMSLGFSSHAHFSAAFQRAFGLSPRALREELAMRKLRQLSKKLKA